MGRKQKNGVAGPEDEEEKQGWNGQTGKFFTSLI